MVINSRYQRVVSASRRYLLPTTLEQCVGVGMLFTAVLLCLAPYASGLENLLINYGVVVTAQAFGAIMALFGAVLILLKRVGRKTFTLLFSPTPIYTGCLFLSFWNSLLFGNPPRVGAIGWILGTSACIAVSWIYGHFEKQRALGVIQWKK